MYGETGLNEDNLLYFFFLSFFMAFLVMNNNDDGIDLCLNILTCCTVSKSNSPLFSLFLSIRIGCCCCSHTTKERDASPNTGPDPNALKKKVFFFYPKRYFLSLSLLSYFSLFFFEKIYLFIIIILFDVKSRQSGGK
jgi:hypothetical protein